MKGGIAKAAACLLLPLLSVLLVFAVTTGTRPGRLFSLKGADLLMRVSADPARIDGRIVLIEVEQGTLDYFERNDYSFPPPRSIYNPMIEYCRAGGAKAVLVDLMFNDMSVWGEAVDEDFAAASRKAGEVYLAAAPANGPEAEREFPAATPGLPYRGAAPSGISYEGLVLPLPTLLEGAAGIGSVSQSPDEDGVYRRLTPFITAGGRLFPSLFAAPLVSPKAEGVFTDGEAAVGALRVPLDGSGRMRVRFHAPPGAYRNYPAALVIASALREAEAMEPELPKEAFRDAYVILGYTAPGLYDIRPTPLSSSSPGMAINAAALDNLLHGDSLRDAPVWHTAALALAGAAAATAGVVVLTSPLAAVGVYAAVGSGLFALLSFAFQRGLLLDLVPLQLSILLSLLGGSIYRYQTEGKQRRFISNAFGHYVSAKVVRQIVEHPERLQLGGERRSITLFFSDLAGFTNISEKMTPQELVALMNDYLSILSQVIMEREGTVDKFIGDAVMAFWGAPNDQQGHARTALLTALECQRRLAPFCETILREKGHVLHTRIGLNTGDCTVGNMGSHERFDYTAVGDTVNQASRLEGLNKAYGTAIIASEATWRAAAGAAFGRQLDFVKVKGKDRPVLIYEVMAPAGEETEAMRLLRGRYEAALEAYRSQRWDAAEAEGAAILETLDDEATRTLLERVRHFRENPPPGDWDGSFAFHTK